MKRYEWQVRKAEFTPVQRIILRMVSDNKWRWRKLETVLDHADLEIMQAIHQNVLENKPRPIAIEAPAQAVQTLEKCKCIVIAVDADEEVYVTLRERAGKDEARGDDFNETRER